MTTLLCKVKIYAYYHYHSGYPNTFQKYPLPASISICKSCLVFQLFSTVNCIYRHNMTLFIGSFLHISCHSSTKYVSFPLSSITLLNLLLAHWLPILPFQLVINQIEKYWIFPRNKSVFVNQGHGMSTRQQPS